MRRSNGRQELPKTKPTGSTRRTRSPTRRSFSTESKNKNANATASGFSKPGVSVSESCKLVKKPLITASDVRLALRSITLPPLVQRQNSFISTDRVSATKIKVERVRSGMMKFGGSTETKKCICPYAPPKPLVIPKTTPVPGFLRLPMEKPNLPTKPRIVPVIGESMLQKSTRKIVFDPKRTYVPRKPSESDIKRKMANSIKASNVHMSAVEKKLDGLAEEMKASKPLIEDYKRKINRGKFQRPKPQAPAKQLPCIKEEEPPESYSLKSRTSCDVHDAMKMQSLYESRRKFYNGEREVKRLDTSASEEDKTTVVATYGSSSCSLLGDMIPPPLTDPFSYNSGYSEGDELSDADSCENLAIQLGSKKSGFPASKNFGSTSKRNLQYVLRTSSTTNGLPVNFKPDVRPKSRKLRRDLRKLDGGRYAEVSGLTPTSSSDEVIRPKVQRHGKRTLGLKATRTSSKNSLPARLYIPRRANSDTSGDSPYRSNIRSLPSQKYWPK